MDVAHHLRDLGYRLTPQRQLVWDALRRSAGRHLSAEEIHQEVTRTVPDFNVASVYRTLTLLEDLGLAKSVNLGDGRGHWELSHPDDEFHLLCRMCKRVLHHSGDIVPRLRKHLAAEHDFTAEQVDLVVHGLCADCKAGS
ncbi:MAG: Fur family transcriptional regulator [Egibacteraceae bacterium]